MTIGDVAAIIEEFAPLSLQESYDNAGLVVGRYDEPLRGGVLLAVDVTEAVVAEAVELGYNLIVTHHPIVFHPIKRLNSASVVERSVEAAIRAGVALYACHTNLDAVCGGMSWKLGSMLRLENMRVLEASDAADNGFGVVGELPSAVELEEFLALCRSTLGTKAIRHSAATGRKIRRVALCTGAGASLMAAARAAKCDAYVTADLKYNDFYLPDGEFVVADVGHFESEFCAIRLLFDILSKKLTNFAPRESTHVENPVHYFV